MPLTPADIRALSRLLDEAWALDAAGRVAWLAALPPEQQQLVPQLREMLSATAEDRIGTLPCLVGSEAVASRGERVGAYRLIREIGRGGMGSVWLAARADGSFKREVALKLPRLAWVAGLAERMLREREINALLEHPGIARLYDAGVDALGRPFIAMEYVEGVPIDVHCRERGLDVPARLRLFLQVVAAVGYAHGRLVVHRDLKPANVLVDAQGRAHLLDFGIAKLIDEAGLHGSQLTREHGRVMTPDYASPEQIAGQTIGVASDVYSLGVMLYELLTDTLPFATKRRTASAVEEAILQGDAPAASSRVMDRKTARALRGDLDAILAKAMKRDPGQRYPTSDALADDIERHRAGQPVKAQPDSTAYRVHKALVRHRFGAMASTAVVAALLAGGVVALLQARHAAQQSEKARAVTNFVAEVFKASTLPVPSASTTDGRSTEPMLDHVGQLIQARFAAQPDVQAELYGVVGRIYADIGAGGPAASYARREIAMLDRMATDRPRLVRAQLLLADSLRADGRLAAASEQAEAAMIAAGTDAGSKHEAQALLGRVQIQLGRIDAASASAAAVESALTAPGARPSIALAWAHFIKGEVLRTQNDVDVALPHYQRAIEMASHLEGPGSSALIDMRLRLAYVLARLNRAEQAQRHFDAAMATLLGMGSSGEVRAATAASAHWAQLYDMRATSYGVAVAEIEKSRQVLAMRARSLPPTVIANLEYRLGVTYLVRGELLQAAPLLEAHAALLLASTEQPTERLYLMATRGHLSMLQGDHERAEQLLRAALQLRQQAGQGQLTFAAFDWTAIAQNLLMQGRFAEATELLDRAPVFASASGDRLNTELFPRLVSIMQAQVLLESGDPHGAVERLSKLTAGLGEDTNSLLRSPRSLHAAALCASGQADDGLRLLTASIHSIAVREGDRHPGLARLRALAGSCALRLGRHDEARRLALLARAAFSAQPGVSAYFEAPLSALERELETDVPAARNRRPESVRGEPGRPRTKLMTIRM